MLLAVLPQFYEVSDSFHSKKWACGPSLLPTPACHPVTYKVQKCRPRGPLEQHSLSDSYLNTPRKPSLGRYRKARLCPSHFASVLKCDLVGEDTSAVWIYKGHNFQKLTQHEASAPWVMIQENTLPGSPGWRDRGGTPHAEEQGIECTSSTSDFTALHLSFPFVGNGAPAHPTGSR